MTWYKCKNNVSGLWEIIFHSMSLDLRKAEVVYKHLYNFKMFNNFQILEKSSSPISWQCAPHCLMLCFLYRPTNTARVCGRSEIKPHAVCYYSRCPFLRCQHRWVIPIADLVPSTFSYQIIIQAWAGSTPLLGWFIGYDHLNLTCAWGKVLEMVSKEAGVELAGGKRVGTFDASGQRADRRQCGGCKCQWDQRREVRKMHTWYRGSDGDRRQFKVLRGYMYGW